MDTEREKDGGREIRRGGRRERVRDYVRLLIFFLSIEDQRPSVCEIADDRTSLQRASGWKIIHFSSQLQEMVRGEMTISFNLTFIT